MNTGVYCLLNTVNGKRYVGSASVSLKVRIKSHRNCLRSGRHGNCYLQRAWNKYGEEAFEFSVLEYCAAESCISREQYWMDEYRSADQRYGYNIEPVAGSSLGVKRSEETKELYREVSRNRWKDEEYRSRMQEAHLGYTVSEETKKKISSAHLGRRFSDQHRANMSKAKIGNKHFVGRKHSIEAKAKVSEARRGKPLSAEHRLKLSEAQRKRMQTEEGKSTVRKAVEAFRKSCLLRREEKQSMPAVKGKSLLISKLGKAFIEAHEQHRGDETEFSQFGELPPGIENGIAQLVDCKFDTYKKGDMEGNLYFYAAGVVVSPSEVTIRNSPTDKGQNIPVRGLRTSIMEPLCDTPSRSRQTIKEHMAWIYNELRKLGMDTASLTPDAVEVACEALKKAQPHFRFRTWRGQPTEQYPDPRTNHSWNGFCEEPTSNEPAMADETAPVAKGPTTAPSKNGAPTAPSATSAEESPDIAQLVAAADAGNPEQLSETALALGIDQAVIDSADSWKAVGELIEAALAGNEGATEQHPDEPEEHPAAKEAPEPKLKGVYAYRPVDPKTKKPVVKAVEVEVTSLDKKTQTVSLVRIDNRKVAYKAVAWSELERIKL